MVMGAVGAAGAVAGTLGDILGMAKNAKATLVVPDDQPAPAGGQRKVECMFNPNSYSLSVDQIVHAAPNAKDAPQPEYLNTNPMTFSCQLFFDEFHKPKGDVTPRISTLLNWMRPCPSTVATNPTAPLVSFVWGPNKQLEKFKGFLTKVNVNYTVFRKDGIPIQAKVDITIQGAIPPDPFTNPTSHAIGSVRAHTVIDGDTLQSIAYRELGKASYWRAVADLNGIDDPLRVSPGRRLLIPTLADATRNG
jgi:nucleoid-associated protein YgaU